MREGMEVEENVSGAKIKNRNPVEMVFLFKILVSWILHFSILPPPLFPSIDYL